MRSRSYVRFRAAARGGFGVAGACAVRGAARDCLPATAPSAGSSTKTPSSAETRASSIRVVAVNGDALLCEYSVCLEKGDTRGPVLERERCVARAAAVAPAEKTESEKTRATARERSGGAEDDDVGLCGSVALNPADPVDLSASMSASMGQSLFLAKK